MWHGEFPRALYSRSLSKERVTVKARESGHFTRVAMAKVKLKGTGLLRSLAATT